MKQFDFARNWRKVKPHLAKPAVVRALMAGMGLLDISYRPGDPPWLFGRGPLNGQRARRGSLSWYQPWGRCHHIAPFAWALGCELYADLSWGLLSGEAHTVALGYQDDWAKPELVMDILLFRDRTAEESMASAMGEGSQFHPTLHLYLASFCNDTQAALEILRRFPI